FKRLTGRRVCADCGRVFNIITSPPGTAPPCERCADRPNLLQRPDDREEVIGKRLEVYEAQTKPLIQHYSDNGMLRVVEADADKNTVFADLRRAVEQGR
ncbi:MAG: adenylate kinase, partial [Steroidobacteraceae bacterium]|nr:adenylate kinase [Steroidobacteraceae bacterium]